MTDITGRLARYMAQARGPQAASDVAREARHRILDTIAAWCRARISSPARWRSSSRAAQGGAHEATVLTTDIRTNAVNAALVNAMFGHADETDDFDPVTKAHPGCSVVPAALAMAERDGRSGTRALTQWRSATTCAAASCWRLDPATCVRRTAARKARARRSARSARQLRSRTSTRRVCGMRFRTPRSRSRASGAGSATPSTSRRLSTSPAWARATASPQRSWCRWASPASGTCSTASTTPSIALSADPNPEAMVADLGTRFMVTETAIKPYSVGYPIQAPLDAFLTLRRLHELTPDNVERIVVKLPEDGARIVNDRSMPDVNCQHIIAVALVDGDVSFDDSHSYERMKDPAVLAVKQRVRLIADREPHGSGCPAQRPRRGDAARRANGQPVHATRAGHEGESDGHRGGRTRRRGG